MSTLSVINAPKIAPSVSLIISADKNYPRYKIHEEKLKSILKNVEKNLLDEFPESKAKKVIKRLHTLTKSIDHKQLSKGIAIFASPDWGRVIYLPFPVKEKVIVDSSFEIRDLLYSIKNSIHYLVLLIDKHPKIYYGYNDKLVESKVKEFLSIIEDVKRDYPSRVANFSDPSEIKKINHEKHLREIDNALTEELKSIDVPIIVCGVKRAIGHFKKITNNGKQIINYIEGNYANKSKEEVYNVIEPYIIEKLDKAENKILNTLKEAVNKNEYECGITNVWKAARKKRGGLLIVEKDYVCPARVEEDNDTITIENIDLYEPHVLQDVVDDIIELILKNGGDVAFVDNERLNEYQKIALITYY